MPKISYKKPSLDNDPNSIFGTSKMVLKQYQQGYEKDPLQPITISSNVGMNQGKLNTKTEGVFGEYTLMIKNLTNSIITGTHYLEKLGQKNNENDSIEGSGVDLEKPLWDFAKGVNKLVFPKGLGHGGKIDPNSVGIGAMFRPPNARTGNKNIGQNVEQGFKDVLPVLTKTASLFGLGLSGGVKYTEFNSKQEAEQYLLNKYAKQKGDKLVPKNPSNGVSSDDLKTAKHFNIYSPAGRQSDNPKILIRYLTKPTEQPPPIPQPPEYEEAIKEPEPKEKITKYFPELPNKPPPPPPTLNDEIEAEGDRFTEHPTGNIGVHGGDPYEKEGDSGSEELEEAEEEFPDLPPPPIHAYETYEGEFSDLPSDTRDDIISFYTNDDNPEYPEDTTNMINNIYTNVVNRAKSSQIGENYILTLFNSINNQINKAMEYWESSISPVFTKISKIKVDSFIKGKTMADFEKALANFEDEVQQQEIYGLLPDFIDKIAVSISENATELFNIMNADIKKFTSGLMNEGDTVSRTLQGGYVQLLRSPYGHLQNCQNKNFL